jgi:hypothetical protein
LPVRKKGRKTSEVSETSEVSQLALWDEGAFTQDMFRVVGAMQQIQEYESADLVTVQEKERLFAETVERERCKWRDIADLWTAAYLGLDLTPELYNACVQYAQGKPVLLQAAQAQALLDQAHRIWEEKRFFHWEIEFPEIFFDQYGQHKGDAAGFDAVVGNPPYDELSEVALGRKIDEKDYLKAVELYREARTYRINLYRLFIACAVDKTKIRGSQGFIVPMSLLGDRFTFELRRKLLTETNFTYMEAFPQKDDPRNRVFFDAKLPTCIYVLTRQLPQREFQVRTHPGKDILDDSPSYCATSEEIAEFDSENFTIPIVGKPEWKLARKLATSSRLCPIGEVAHPMSGEVVFNKAFRSYLSDNPEHTLVLRGGHIQRYEIIDDPKQGTPVYIDKDRWLADSQEGTAAFAYQKPRIVYQESAALDNWRRIIATFLPAGNVCGHKICYFVDVRYDELAFLALFNSNVVEWRFRLVSTTNNLAAYQITAIPIPKVSFITPADERSRLMGVGIAKAAGWIEGVEGDSADSATFSAFSDSKLGRWLKARLSAKPEQADVVHDLLAHLAEQMIEMNKEKQAEVKGFLGWLADYTGMPVDDWALKTNLQRYYEHDWAEMQRILKRNQRKLPKVDLDVDAYRNKPVRKIREAWETSMETLRPLLKDIKATDRLIDRIVYELYGLTEEEIAVVERRGV